MRLKAHSSQIFPPYNLKKGVSVPDRAHGEVRVVRSLPVQSYHGGVSVVNEDVGAALNEGHRRARYHLHSHTVVTVHHTANNLNLKSRVGAANESNNSHLIVNI